MLPLIGAPITNNSVLFFFIYSYVHGLSLLLNSIKKMSEKQTIYLCNSFSFLVPFGSPPKIAELLLKNKIA